MSINIVFKEVDNNYKIVNGLNRLYMDVISWVDKYIDTTIMLEQKVNIFKRDMLAMRIVNEFNKKYKDIMLNNARYTTNIFVNDHDINYINIGYIDGKLTYAIY